MAANRIPVVILNESIRGKRYMLSDMDAFILRNRSHYNVWDASAEELPMQIVKRLTKLSEPRAMKSLGYIKDYTPDGVRNYIRRQYKDELISEIRKEYRELIDRTRLEIVRLKHDRQKKRTSIDAPGNTI